MFKHLASIRKPKGNTFHFYYFLPKSKKIDHTTLYCAVDDDKPSLDKNIMEYYPKEKWLVLKDFKGNKGIKKEDGENAKLRKVRLLGIRIENYIINKIFFNFRYNILDMEYTYTNYLQFLKTIKGKKGYFVRVCINVKQCHSVNVVSTTSGTKVDYNRFRRVTKQLNKWPHNPRPLIYHLTNEFYFIALRSENAHKFRCYKCIIGKYYRNSSLYDLDRFGWQKQASRNDSPGVE